MRWSRRLPSQDRQKVARAGGVRTLAFDQQQPHLSTVSSSFIPFEAKRTSGGRGRWWKRIGHVELHGVVRGEGVGEASVGIVEGSRAIGVVLRV